MSKRPAESGGNGNGKVARLEGGVVKKTGPRLPMLMYKEGEPLHDLHAYLEQGEGQSVEIRIPSQSLSTNNRQVRARQLWGSDIYTSDSDLVAVLMHCGFIYHSLPHPPVNVAEVRAVVRPLPPQEAYASTARNSIRSRAWAAPAAGCSYRVEKAWVVTRTGNSYDLPPNLEGVPAAAATFAPSHLERMVTRSAAGPGSRARHVQEVTAVFNLVNEPWVKYTPAAVSDRGLKPHEWTSARLHTDVLYLESHRRRYELCRVGGAAARREGAVPGAERYRFSLCRKPLTARRMRQVGVPLPEAEREVLHEGVEWEEVRWGPAGVVLRGQSYPLMRIHFVPIELEEEQRRGAVLEGGQEGEASGELVIQ